MTVLDEGNTSKDSSTSHNAKSEELTELAVSRRTTKDTSKASVPVTVHEEYRDRLQAYTKNLTKNLISFTDKLDVRDPQCITELCQSIFNNMREEEKH